MDAETLRWWTLLCGVSVLNVAAWALTVAVVRRRAAQAALGAAATAQLVLSAAYVAGCAFRSVFPVYDVPRLALIDSAASAVLVGRSVATVAELCFAAQWACLLNGLAQEAGSTGARRVAWAVVPLIALAEVCSWTAVLTTSNLGHVLEETIWGSVALALVCALLPLMPRLAPARRRFVALCGVAGIAYVGYMFLVDVPMYWSRWLADEAAGRRYLDIAQGFADVATRRVVSARWQDWRGEVVWMTLYFSAAVWLSIGLVHAALPRRRAG